MAKMFYIQTTKRTLQKGNESIVLANEVYEVLEDGETLGELLLEYFSHYYYYLENEDYLQNFYLEDEYIEAEDAKEAIEEYYNNVLYKLDEHAKEQYENTKAIYYEDMLREMSGNKSGGFSVGDIMEIIDYLEEYNTTNLTEAYDEYFIEHHEEPEIEEALDKFEFGFVRFIRGKQIEF